MNTLEAIAARRSIRRYQDRPIAREVVERVLAATVQAPSAKNQQPWRFVVLEGRLGDGLVEIMRQQAARLKELGIDIGSLEWSANVIAQAPVTIVVLNAPPPPEVPAEAHDDYDHVMVQSTGGAIQTMLLAATELGLGSLWICDILYAAREILEWLGRPGHVLIGAVSLGYAAEAPAARPRRPWQEVTEWVEPQGLR